MRREKGITLIALIITIIVMLVLVAVTVSVALNGGLFGQAREASGKTRKEAMKEQLMSIVIGSFDSNGDFSLAEMEDKLPANAKWCSVSDTEYDEATTPNPITGYIITKSNDRFYIDQHGTVTIIEPTT